MIPLHMFPKIRLFLLNEQVSSTDIKIQEKGMKGPQNVKQNKKTPLTFDSQRLITHE